MRPIASYGTLEPRKTQENSLTVDDIVNKKEVPEKKKGALANLKSRFEDFKAKLQRAQNNESIEKKLSEITNPLTPADMKAALQNIRRERLASTVNKNPAKVTSLPKQETALREHAQSLRDTITLGLTTMLQGVEHSAKYDAADVANFSDRLAICLGLGPKDSKLTMDQFSSLVAVKSDIEMHLQPEVRAQFDKAMLAAENQLDG
jgi:hypothetical protein